LSFIETVENASGKSQVKLYFCVKWVPKEGELALGSKWALIKVQQFKPIGKNV